MLSGRYFSYNKPPFPPGHVNATPSSFAEYNSIVLYQVGSCWMLDQKFYDHQIPFNAFQYNLTSSNISIQQRGHCWMGMWRPFVWGLTSSIPLFSARGVFSRGRLFSPPTRTRTTKKLETSRGRSTSVVVLSLILKWTCIESWQNIPGPTLGFPRGFPQEEAFITAMIWLSFLSKVSSRDFMAFSALFDGVSFVEEAIVNSTIKKSRRNEDDCIL